MLIQALYIVGNSYYPIVACFSKLQIDGLCHQTREPSGTSIPASSERATVKRPEFSVANRAAASQNDPSYNRPVGY